VVEDHKRTQTQKKGGRKKNGSDDRNSLPKTEKQTKAEKPKVRETGGHRPLYCWVKKKGAETFIQSKPIMGLAIKTHQLTDMTRGKQ